MDQVTVTSPTDIPWVCENRFEAKEIRFWAPPFSTIWSQRLRSRVAKGKKPYMVMKAIGTTIECRCQTEDSDRKSGTEKKKDLKKRPLAFSELNHLKVSWQSAVHELS